MKIMVSACLLGEKCKYSGGDNYSEKELTSIAKVLGCKFEGHFEILDTGEQV